MTEQIETLNLQTQVLRTEMAGLGQLADSVGAKLVNAFAGAAIHGRKLSDVLRGLALSLAQTALTSALKPLGNLLGGLFSNVIGGAKLTPFATGGIVNSPTLFPLRGGAAARG